MERRDWSEESCGEERERMSMLPGGIEAVVVVVIVGRDGWGWG